MPVRAPCSSGLSGESINYSQFATTKVGPDLGAFLPPLLPGSAWKQQFYDYFPSASWGITKWSKHPKEAYEFISYLADAKNQDSSFKLTGAVPEQQASRSRRPLDKVGQQILGWTKQYPPVVGQVDLIRSSVDAVYEPLVPQILTGRPRSPTR